MSRYPLVEASVRLVVDQFGLGSGSQPRFLDNGAGDGERDGEGRGRLIFGKSALEILRVPCAGGIWIGYALGYVVGYAGMGEEAPGLVPERGPWEWYCLSTGVWWGRPL